MPPRRSTTVSTRRRSSSRFADVGDDAERGIGAVGVGDLVDDGIDGVLAEVDDGDAGTLVGEQVGRRPAHAAGCAGDDGPPAGDRSGQVGEAHPQDHTGRVGTSPDRALPTRPRPLGSRPSSPELPPQGSRGPQRGANGLHGLAPRAPEDRLVERGRPPATYRRVTLRLGRCNRLAVAPIPGRRGGLMKGGASPPPPTGARPPPVWHHDAPAEESSPCPPTRPVCAGAHVRRTACGVRDATVTAGPRRRR